MLSVASHWRRYKELYSLQGSTCVICGKAFFPARRICPNCRREGKIVPLHFSGKGKVYTYAIIRAPPEGFEKYTPYVIALIELEEGPKVTSQVVDSDPESVEIGMPVEICFRRLRDQNREGVIIYGFKFRPADADLEKRSST